MTSSVTLPALSWLDILDALDLASEVREGQSLNCPRCQRFIQTAGIPCRGHDGVVDEAFAIRGLRRHLMAQLAEADRTFVSAVH